MADLFSHLLIVWSVLTIASWHYEWLTPRWVAVGVIGAIFPDLSRVAMIVPDSRIETLLGMPFSWDVLHTLGGALLLAAMGAQLFARERGRAFVLLSGGAVLHLLTDAVKIYSDGYAAMWLYPVTNYRHPSMDLYVSSDPTVLVVSVLFAGIVFVADRRLVDRASRVLSGDEPV